MPKKSRARKSIKQTQKQEQRQNISIKIGELPVKKRRRRPRKVAKPPGSEAPMRQLPPVVYQTLPQLVGYNPPEPTIAAPPKPATSIVAPVKVKTTILEDVGQVGTEGPVEILELPTKRETLRELITPVDIPRMQVDPVEEGPMFGLFAKETRTRITDEPEMRTTIAEPRQKRSYTKSGKYSKKPEPQRPVSPLTFEGSFGIAPESIYTETQPLYSSPMAERSAPTKFRSNTPEGFFTQKAVNKFFEPRKRDTSPKPIYKGEGPIIRRSRAIV
jgi:hypothetical protein